MDFINKFGNMVNKGIDSIKSQINKTQENSLTTSQQYNNLPKGVHILGEDDQPVPELNNLNQANQNINKENDYNKYYYSQQNEYQPLSQTKNTQSQNKPQSSSIRDLLIPSPNIILVILLIKKYSIFCPKLLLFSSK